MTMRLTVPSAVLSIWAMLIEERAGIHYRVDDYPLLEDKLTARSVDLGFDSLLDYYYFVRYDPTGPEELQKLLETLVVNETYFFREWDQVIVAVQRFVLPVVQTGRRARIWSAACATGEEPLSIAMLLSHLGVLGQVELLASDLSQPALDRARAGRYGKRSVRSELPAYARAWLRPAEHGYTLEPTLRSAIRWQRANLTDEAAVRAMPRCDLVLCRNVLIYFSDATASRVVASLAEVLHPGAALVVGVSESLLRFGTSLACEEHDRVFVYRKAS
jgi:chemotaxis protein methyltransferase CheR